MTTATRTKYDVGGVMLDRPFKIRRLGHFGFNVKDMQAGARFYCDLLGFRQTDVFDTPEGPRGIFTRYGGDHHAFVLFKMQPPGVQGPGASDGSDITINQITWQVGSLAEVGNAGRWLTEQGVPFRRTGRDMPGSNWHTYVGDPDGHTNEIYYGIEQIGWDGFSKPQAMYYRGFREAPTLPQMNEYQEVQEALAKGIDIHSGFRPDETHLPAKYDVDGIMLPRPFKITRIGPVGLFVKDLDASATFYRDKMGFAPTEETQLMGERCLFLRTNTEHHAVALFPVQLRQRLGFSGHTSSAYFGVQLANYRQLRDAVSFLRENGVRVETDLPAELHPGVDYAAYAFDPEGHCIELYYYMEQVGWDGQVRPRSERRVANGAWPETVDAVSDTYSGEPFLGPWG
jgi:catechol 2,3-dioxygenase-like lactoylglutathione lyase family enzyme